MSNFSLCPDTYEAVQELFSRKHNSESRLESPYYEKWGRGRPSKEKLEKRRLHKQWTHDNREALREQWLKDVEETQPFLSHLINKLPKPVTLSDGNINFTLPPSDV